MKITNKQFLIPIFGDWAPWSHITSFLDDPMDIPQSRRGICWAGGYAKNTHLIPNSNQYICISLFGPDDEGKARRRKALFRATYCVVLDDVREKLDVEAAGRLPKPSWILETSPGSEQWGFILETPCTDRNQIDNLNDGLIASELAPDGKDPGQKGVTRYVRLPEGVNTKASRVAANGGMPPRCRMLEWHPERKVTMEALAAPFGIDLDAPRHQVSEGIGAEIPDHPVLQHVHVHEVKASGEYLITCPWVDGHTGAADDGTWLKVVGNGSIGFKCHHGTCQGRTGGDFLKKLDLTRTLDRWRCRRLMESVL